MAKQGSGTPRKFDAQRILKKIAALGKKLGRSPTADEFTKETGISSVTVRYRHGSWNKAVALAGLQPFEKLKRIDNDKLLGDWGDVVANMGRIPTALEYDRHGNHGSASFHKHFGGWSQVPARFRARFGNIEKYTDVIALIDKTPRRKKRMRDVESANLSWAGTGPNSKYDNPKLDGRPTFGININFRGLRHAPVNEQGVVFLFGMVARELGYVVESVQTGFPDCEAKRRVSVDTWQRVRIEFEFESINFKLHGHPIDGCDIIVCWRHNWSDCPQSIEFLELCSVIKTLGEEKPK